MGLAQFIQRLKCSESGNAMLITAFAMPALIGSAGVATDVAQWYMWKRELQYAVDQSAMAGAYAMANSNSTIRDTYSDRARQEYNANVSKVADFDDAAGPNISLAIYGAGAANNSVLVTASATKSLPFSTYLTKRATTVNVRAQATYASAVNFSVCMFAVNRTASAALEFGNSIGGSSACGAGTLSNNNKSAAKETGDSNIPLGSVIAAGDVDSTFSNNGKIYKNQDGLSDPYASLSAPSSTGQATQTYPSTCPVATPASTTYNASGMTWTHFTYKYYQGANSNNWNLLTNYSGSGYIANSWNPNPDTNFTIWAVTAPARNGAFPSRARATRSTPSPQRRSLPPTASCT
jgi:Flp pilus assembly protein TadG